MANRNTTSEMTNRASRFRLASGVFFLILLCSSTAEAYLDPSTGSMVISAIVGIVASIALAVKTYWYKLKAVFRRDPENDKRPLD